MGLFCFLPALLFGEQSGHAGRGDTAAGSLADPPFKVTINPEARVSVRQSGNLPSAKSCGFPTEFLIAIDNQGMVTGQLEAELISDPLAKAALNFYPEPLSGAPKETRRLYITLKEQSGVVDLTIAFRLKGVNAELGGRDRVHFLMHCLRVN